MSEQNTQPQQSTQITVTVRSLLEQAKYQSAFKKVIGDRAPQFMASITQLANMPHLKEAEPRSVIAAAYVAATLDLPIDRNLGFAHIVPYKARGGPPIAQFQMGYKGFIQLGLRTGQYSTINDVAVPEGVFQSHDPLTGDLVLDWKKKSSDTIAGYACFFRLLNGYTKTVYWSKEKVVNHARRYSKSYKAGAAIWRDNFDEMALKTVIKFTLSRYGILSVEMRGALAHDQGTQDDIEADVQFPDTAEVEVVESEDGGGSAPEKSGGMKSAVESPTVTPTTEQKAPTPAAVVDEARARKILINRIEGTLLDKSVTESKFMELVRKHDPKATAMADASVDALQKAHTEISTS